MTRRPRLAGSGAVGGVAVQLAKAAGARVVAIAGGRQRTEHTKSALGADDAVDYRDPAFPQRLRDAAGDGIDVFFDNVGGRPLALSVMRNHGTVVLCGQIASYARPDDPGGVRRPARRGVQADHAARLHRQRLLPPGACSRSARRSGRC